MKNGITLLWKVCPAYYEEFHQNRNADCYCMNCFYSFRTESNRKSHENVCKDYDYRDMIMPEKDNKAF